jgi:uncharacterized protein YjbI with pentapeptide repeats
LVGDDDYFAPDARAIWAPVEKDHFMATKRNDPVRRPPRLDEDTLTVLGSFGDEDDLLGVEVSGDFAGAEYALLTLRESRIAGVVLTGSRLLRATFVDCVVADSDLSGAVFDDCRFDRVEFRHSRLSGMQAHGSRFVDVALLDCKADGANFRMTGWERAELRDTCLAESDFYGAKLRASRIHGCDLTQVELSKCDLTGSQLQRSQLDGIRGADSLRGVTIGTDQVVPAALALFTAFGITVDDDAR